MNTNIDEENDVDINSKNIKIIGYINKIQKLVTTEMFDVELFIHKLDDW